VITDNGVEPKTKLPLLKYVQKIHIMDVAWRNRLQTGLQSVRSLVRLPAMDDFSKDGFSGNHIPLISVLICIMTIHFCPFDSLRRCQNIQYKGGNSQNFLRKFVIFFLTLRCFYGVVIHRK